MDNFHDVPSFPTLKVVSGDYSNIAMAREERWKRNRDLCANTFSKLRLKTTSPPILHYQCTLLMNQIDKVYNDGKLFYVHDYMKKYSANITLDAVFSTKMDYEDKRLARLVDLTTQNFFNNQAGNICDVIKILQPFYYVWIKYVTGVPVDELKVYMKELYDEHLRELDEKNPKDLFDQIILDYGDTDLEGILRLGNDLFLTGVEAGAVTMEWVLLYLTNYPDIQQKMYQELKMLLDQNEKMINLTHRINSPYTNAVIKEVMRLSPAAVFGLPRLAKEDVEIGGYTIAKGTQIMMNLHGVHHDERYFDNPDDFIPDRWLEDNSIEGNSKKASNIAFLPYSVGPRSCIGQHLSNDFIFVGISNIVLNYKLESPDGKPIDSTQVFGLTIRSKPYSIKLNKRNK